MLDTSRGGVRNSQNHQLENKQQLLKIGNLDVLKTKIVLNLAAITFAKF